MMKNVKEYKEWRLNKQKERDYCLRRCKRKKRIKDKESLKAKKTWKNGINNARKRLIKEGKQMRIRRKCGTSRFK